MIQKGSLWKRKSIIEGEKKVNLEATVADLISSVNWLALKANSSVEEVLSHT